MSRVVLVTGATDGIGRAVVEHLAAAGHTVLAHGRDPEKLAALPAARTYQADLTSLDEIHAMADAILEAEPRIDTLLNNAGIGFTIPGGPERSLTPTGVELRFAVIYLAGYGSPTGCSTACARRRPPGSSSSPPWASRRSTSTT